jgi:hypothetical protein
MSRSSRRRKRREHRKRRERGVSRTRRAGAQRIVLAFDDGRPLAVISYGAGGSDVTVTPEPGVEVVIEGEE